MSAADPLGVMMRRTNGKDEKTVCRKRTHECIHVCVYVFYKYAHARTRAHTHIHIHTHTHTYTHVHTQTRTHTQGALSVTPVTAATAAGYSALFLAHEEDLNWQTRKSVRVCLVCARW